MKTAVRKRMPKKLGAFILALVLLFSYGCEVYAASPNEKTWKAGESVTAVLQKNGTLSLTGTGSTYQYTKDAAAPWCGSEVKAVKIGNKITSIGDYNFYNCGSLTGRLDLPKTLLSIGKGAFNGETAATSPHFRAINSRVSTTASALAVKTTDSAVSAGTELLTEEDAFAPAQGNSYYYCEKANLSFADAMERAGYQRAEGLTAVTYRDTCGQAVADCLKTKNGILLEDFPDTLNVPNDGTLFAKFSGWRVSKDQVCAPWSIVSAREDGIYEAVFQIENRELTEQILHTTISGMTVTVSGRLPKNASVTAKEIKAADVKPLVAEKTGDAQPTIYFALDITVLVNGKKYQPKDYGRDVSVSISNLSIGKPQDLRVLHVDAAADEVKAAAKGNTEELAAEVVKVDSATAKQIQFTADSFSIYIGAAVFADLWDGTVDTSWYDASQSSFNITKASQLAGLASLVNAPGAGTAISMLSGKTFNLQNDLILNVMDNNAWTTHARAWTPIGGQAYYCPAFNGTFNGNGHTISGLYVNSAVQNTGLFGYIESSGIVQNLIVRGYVASAGGNAGGFAGINRGTIQSCVSRCTVVATGSQYYGGFTGGNSGLIDKCLNEGAVTGNEGNTVAGITGYLTGKVRNCGNTGAMSCTETASGVNAYAGGIVGHMDANDLIMAKVYNCYNNGSIYTYSLRGNSFSGGIAGCLTTYQAYTDTDGIAHSQSMQSQIYNCYSSGALTADRTGGMIGFDAAGYRARCYYSTAYGPEGTLVANTSTYSYNGSQVYPLAVAGGANATFTGPGSAVGGFTNLQAALQDRVTNADFDRGYVLSWVQPSTADYPVLSGLLNDVSTSGDCWQNFGNYTTSWAGSTGEDGKYHIGTAAQLAGLSVLVNGKDNSGNTVTANSFAGKTIVLDNDILLNGAALTRQWMPIGNSSSLFSGTFDGNSHTISGVYVSGIGSQATYWRGFFGGAGSNSSIENLDLSGKISCTGIQQIAAFVGIEYGKISNCKNYCSVLTDSDTAAAFAAYVAPAGIVDHCVNYGSVTGTGSATKLGGVACGVRNTVKNCANYGNVTLTSSQSSAVYAGGICGNAGLNTTTVIENCYNAGTVAVTAATAYAGAIVGYSECWGTGNATNLSIKNCYNIGTITATGGTAILGAACKGGTNSTIVVSFNSCYYLSGTLTAPYCVYNSGAAVGGSGVASFASGEKATLLTYLNTFVTGNSSDDLLKWNLVADQNSGYPIFGWATTATMSGTDVYANGNWLIIVGGAGSADSSTVKTTVYIDENKNDKIDTGEQSLEMTGLGAPADWSDLSNFKIYAGTSGSGSYSGSTHITMLGGNVGRIYGGNAGDNNATSVAGDANIYISGGRCGMLCGGGYGSVAGGIHITMTGGTVDNLYAGGDGGTVGSITATLSGGTVSGPVYGGSWGPTGGVEDHTTITLSGVAVTGNVYGGGLQGTTGGNTTINFSKGTVGGNIYGGGTNFSATAITGNTNINIFGTAQVSGNVYGGGGTYLASSAGTADVTGNTNITMTGGTVSGSVYGGDGVSNSSGSGAVSGTATVVISGGTIGVDVYGGGTNGNVASSVVTLTNANVMGSVYGGASGTGSVLNGAAVAVNAGTAISGSVYGGGFGGTVCTGTSANGRSAFVTVNAGTVTGSVYGGGSAGDIGSTASPGMTQVDIRGGTVSAYVYGGCNSGTVYGASSSTFVNVSGGTVSSLIFGGGNTGKVEGNTNAVVSGGSVYGVCGGCNTGTVSGKAAVTVTGGTFNAGGYACGGGFDTHSSAGSTEVNINTGAHVPNVYGGSIKGLVAGNTTVNVNGGTVSANVYGGGRESTSTVSGTAAVNIISGTAAGSVYGGGVSGSVHDTAVNVSGGTVDNNVYGGGYGGTVAENAVTTLSGGTVAGTVYGGGMTGAVGGMKTVRVTGNPVIGTPSSGGIDLASITNTKVLISGWNSLTGSDGSIYLIPSTVKGGTVLAGNEDSSAVTDNELAKFALHNGILTTPPQSMDKDAENIVIRLSAINATVPLKVTAIHAVDGTVAVPTAYRITNHSNAAIRVTSVTWTRESSVSWMSNPDALSLSINHTVLPSGTAQTSASGLSETNWPPISNTAGSNTLSLNLAIDYGTGNTFTGGDTNEHLLGNVVYVVAYAGGYE